MKNDKMIIALDEYVEGFKTKMSLGLNAIAEAAKCYADALMRHPTLAPERFRKEYPMLSESSWTMLERIGNGDLEPMAYFLPIQTARKISHLPIETQKQMLTVHGQGFECVSPYTSKAVTVPLAALSVAQSNILFDMERGKVRTVEEQRKIIAERNNTITAAVSTKKKAVKYQIIGNVCIINGVEIGKGELKRILTAMERKV